VSAGVEVTPKKKLDDRLGREEGQDGRYWQGEEVATRAIGLGRKARYTTRIEYQCMHAIVTVG
jgi:hypothetical protein